MPYFHWVHCQGLLVLQQAYLRQLLLGYVEIEPCDKRDELKSVGRSTDNSNASTDDDEAFATPLESI